MIKICFLTSVHPPFDTRIFLKEAMSLAKAGYDVSLAAQHDKDEIVDGIRIASLPKPKNRLERMTRTVWTTYRKALEIDADIYHFHDPELIPIGLLLKRKGKRVIYDVHEDVPRQNLSKSYIPAAFRKPISGMIEALEAFSARRFDGVVTATPYINRRFLELGANAVNVNNYPLIGELDSAVHWAEKQDEVFYVGAISAIRGVREIVRSCEFLKSPTRLNLAGRFSESAVETELKSYPGWTRVNELGFLDRAGLRDVLKRSVAGLVTFHPLPNHIYAQPNKMFEYMSAGIPVIASNFPLWREIIETNDCGLCVNPLDPRAIATAIDHLVMNPELSKRMSDNGRQAVLSKYNWSIEERKLCTFYEGLL